MSGKVELRTTIDYPRSRPECILIPKCERNNSSVFASKLLLYLWVLT